MCQLALLTHTHTHTHKFKKSHKSTRTPGPPCPPGGALQPLRAVARGGGGAGGGRRRCSRRSRQGPQHRRPRLWRCVFVHAAVCVSVREGERVHARKHAWFVCVCMHIRARACVYLLVHMQPAAAAAARASWSRCQTLYQPWLPPLLGTGVLPAINSRADPHGMKVVDVTWPRPCPTARNHWCTSAMCVNLSTRAGASLPPL